MEDKKNSQADKCKCIKIEGHLEDIQWTLTPRKYRPSPGYLALGDWTDNPYIWLHYVESCDGYLADDDVLMSTYTRHWEINDVQRYFLGNEHCEEVLFVYQYPNMRMPTPYGNRLWRSNTAMKLPSNTYQKALYRNIDITLKKMVANEDQVDRLIVPDQLVNVDRLDYFRRKSFFQSLLNFLSLQDHLQLVSFENMRCKRLEGVRLIQQLGCFNAQSLKYLYLWDFVLPNENPLLINYSYITGSGQYLPRPSTKQCFLRSLGSLQNLRVLALEYSYIADGTGGALLSLLPVIKRPHFRLQLMCREYHIPGRTDAALGAGGYDIPDTVWRRVIIACPDLYLFLAFFEVRDYDNIRRFLTPSMCVREIHWQLGVDLKRQQRQDSDLSCYLRHLAFFYSNTLVTVGIYRWRSATFSLRYVFELMPQLMRLFYVGCIEDEVELRRLFDLVSTGVCVRLKQIRIQVQADHDRRIYWKSVVDTLNNDYREIMILYDITLTMGMYLQKQTPSEIIPKYVC